jgi:hypothetical protein
MCHRSWKLLRFLSGQSSLPWLCAWYFNEILDAGEQFGGNTCPEQQMEGFRDAVEVCGFTDLGYIGVPYTWDNRQQGDDNIKVRLDRGFENGSFLNLFQMVKLWHVQTTESDHCALIIECQMQAGCAAGKRKPFRYENMWRRDESYLQLVRNAWGVAALATDMGQLQQRLRQVQDSLQD